MKNIRYKKTLDNNINTEWIISKMHHVNPGSWRVLVNMINAWHSNYSMINNIINIYYQRYLV